MELHSTFFFITLFFLFSLIWLAKNNKRNYKSHSSIQKLPPGPWKLPLIGNLHQIAMAGSHPHHALRELSFKYGPLMHLQLGEISTVVVSSAEMAKEILKTHGLTFANRPQLLCPKILGYGAMEIAFAPYGDYWRQMRKISTLELLSAKRVQSFTFVREEEVTNLIESIVASANSPINITTKIFSLLIAIVSRAVCGKKSEDEEEIISVMKKAAEMLGGFDLADLFPSLRPIHIITRMEYKLEKMHEKLDKILKKILNEGHVKKKMKASEGKWESEKENLVDVLLRVQQSGDLNIPLTDNNIKAVVLGIFGAGLDTTATALEWAMSELMRNPKVREKAQAEIRAAFKGKKIIHEIDLEQLSYIKLVIKETLRLHPSGPLMIPRECREDCKIGGYDIPKKTTVMVNAWALGRDPKYWYDAEKFIPERFDDTCVDFKGTNLEYIPFGAGKRMCPGMSFGLTIIELALVCLLYHFDWELPDGMKAEDMDMTEAVGAAVGRKNNLYLIPTPYNP